MGRRSKADLYDLVDRILLLYTREKMNIREIADKLNEEGIDISREAVRRSLKSSRELATDMRRSLEEARVMMDEVRNNPNTDIAEAVVTRIGGLLLRETQNIEALEFDDPNTLVLSAARLAQAQTKIGTLKMKYRNGYEDAKADIMRDLKTELAADPDLYSRLAEKIQALAPQEKK